MASIAEASPSLPLPDENGAGHLASHDTPKPSPSVGGGDLSHIENCTHELVEEGSCLECGLAITGDGSHMQREEEYSTSHQRAAAVSTMGFEKDLEGKDLPPEIKAWVLRMAAAAPKHTLRMASRDRRLFAYVYLAYLELGYPLEPEKIATTLGIDKSQLPEALRLASGISPTPLPQSHNNPVTAPMVVLSPVAYLDDALAVLKMEVYKDTIQALMEKALVRDPLLYEERPKWMAVAIIKYYLDLNGASMVKFHDHFGMTATSVKGCVAKIQGALK